MAIREVKGKMPNGDKYKFTTMPVRKGGPIKIKIGKIFSPAIVGAMGKLKTDKDGDEAISVSDMAGNVAELFDRMDEGNAFELMTSCLEGLYIKKADATEDDEYERVDVDSYFSANYEDMYRMVGIVLKENFGSLMSLVGISPTSLMAMKDKVLS